MNTEAFRINDLPDEIIRKILLHVSGNWLCKNVIHVCKKWHSVIDTESFWVQKGVFKKRIDRRVVDLMHDSNLFISKQLYFYRPFSRNLLKNGFCHDLKHWCIMLTSVKLFDIGRLQTYAHLQNPQLPEGNKAVIEYYNMHCEASQTRAYRNDGCGWNVDDYDVNDDVAYRLAQKFQVIDLYAEGLDATIMAIKPKIYISYSYVKCGGENCIWVTLLNSNYEVIDSYSFARTHLRSFELPNRIHEKIWFEASHTFENYTNDARYIVYYHSGIDLGFWGGVYDIKITKLTLKVLLD